MKIKKKYFIIVLIFIALFYNHGYFVLKRDDSYLKTIDIHKPPYSGVITYLINLDRSPHRLDYMMPKIEKLGLPFQRIKAVDAKTLSDEEIKTKFDLKQYYTLRKIAPLGSFGCSLSHIDTWKTFLESNYEYALILEDDAHFDPTALSQTIYKLLKNTQYWDMHTFDPKFRGTPLTITKLDIGQELVVYLTQILNATAYLISRKAAEQLLSHAFPIIMPIDCYYTRAWELDIKITGTYPRLIEQKYGFSQILSSERLTLETLGISQLQYLTGIITHPLYKLQTAIIRFLYNLKLYFIMKLS